MKLIDAFEFIGKQRPTWMTAKGTWRKPVCFNRSHALRLLGSNTKVQKITKAHLAEMRSTLMSEKLNNTGKTRSVGGVNRIMSLINTLMRDLFDQEIVTRLVHLKGMKENNQRKSWFRKEQIEEMCQRARANGNEELAAAILFAAYTGCRQSELLNLMARDVDLHSDLMIFRDTKDGDDFETNILPVIKPLLVERLKVKQGTQKVFDFKNNDQLRSEFYKIRDEMGIDDTHVFHSVRHSTGTWLAEAGVSINQIAMVLNHKQTSTTERYVKKTSIQRKTALESLL